jgi:3-methyladenine DNA glycosylase AlkD
MTFAQVMAKLKRLGTAQNRKIYARHGATGEIYGVSFAHLNQLEKEIGTDHELAERLWEIGILDAMWLATKIADPDRLTSATADEWLATVDSSPLAGPFATLIARTPVAERKVDKWTRSRKERIRETGYTLLAELLRQDPEALDDEKLAQLVKTIEREINGSPNRARYAMNNALIAIGTFRPRFHEAAVAAAKRIGRVDVDHGETGCKTPDAVAYLEKTAARRKATGKVPHRRRC